jgi:hypothetical protein
MKLSSGSNGIGSPACAGAGNEKGSPRRGASGCLADQNVGAPARPGGTRRLGTTGGLTVCCLVGWVSADDGGWASRGASEDGRKRADGARLTHFTLRTPHTKNPGAVSRPGTLRQFQFPEYCDSMTRVKRNSRPMNLLPNLAGIRQR